jgi:trimeric autotransporter adhesin
MFNSLKNHFAFCIIISYLIYHIKTATYLNASYIISIHWKFIIKNKRMKTTLLFATGLLLCISGFSQNVGIGTTTPLARLHVTDSSVLFSATGDIPVTPGLPALQGQGRRMMWYPEKAAFRVGYVDGTNWDKDSIGNYSFASGVNTRSKGTNSTAMGNNSIASGDYSAALGYNTRASGSYSTAMGYYTTASGYYSTATGFFTSASGNYSMAIGRFTTAKAMASLSIGLYNDDTDNPNPNNFGLEDRVFQIGIGDGPRINAMTVLRNGKTGLGTVTPVFKLDVRNGSINVDSVYRIGAITVLAVPGSSNLFVGRNAGNTTIGWQNTSVGENSLVTNTDGAYNTALGYNTGPNGTNYVNTTCIGIDATATGSNMVRIGNIYVGSIGGYQNWTNISDSRFKQNIKEDVSGLDFIMKLKPVTYSLDAISISKAIGIKNSFSGSPDLQAKYISERNSARQTGFIAQDVEKAAMETGYDFSGVDKPKNPNDFYGLRYAEFVVPLVKAVQEQQVIIEQQNKKIEMLMKEITLIKEKLR